MKFLHTLVLALVGGVVLTLAVGARAQSPMNQYATVVRIQGEARYSPGNNAWYPLVVGKVLGPGDIVQTAERGTVDLVLGNKITDHIVGMPAKVAPASDAIVRGMVSYRAEAEQNVIRLEGNTVLAINTLSIVHTGVDSVSNTELDLRQGTIFGTVKKLSAASQFLIKTPNGIAGVRGTTFIVSADGTITVVSGSMVASHTDANGHVTTVVLGPGEQYNPATGQVTKITHKEFAAAMRTAVQIVTLQEGVISYAKDETVLYVSPVRGNQGNHGHWSWPF